MTNYSSNSSNGEVFGANALYAAMVIGAALLLLGALWSPAPQASPAKAQNPAVEEVVVTAPVSAQVAG
jgi:hypothetical protein